MKTVKIILIALLAMVVFTNSQAGTIAKNNATKTESFKVSGNCGMCKARIESAAKIDGVTSAAWNQDTKMLKLTYNPTVVKSEEVLKKIAVAGHDTDKFKSDTKTYNALPGCCKYR
jgi:copper chaperone CopZ